MLRRIVYTKARSVSRFLPYKAGAYLATHKYNHFLERGEKVGFKLKNIEARRLMVASDSRESFLLLLRRVGKETYRRLSLATEAQFNALAATAVGAAAPFVAPGVVHQRSARYQAYVGRLVTLRNLWTNALRLGLRSLTHRSTFHPASPASCGRLDFYHFRRFRRRRT